jgi:hypothetical protein
MAAHAGKRSHGGARAPRLWGLCRTAQAVERPDPTVARSFEMRERELARANRRIETMLGLFETVQRVAGFGIWQLDAQLFDTIDTVIR